MPYFIPGAAIGVGIALTVWGARQIINGDDSADEAAAKVLGNIPEYIRRYIEEVEVSVTGVKIRLRQDAPESVEEEIRENVDVEGRSNGVEIER